VRTFTFFIEDDRYTVPTLAIVTVADEGRARAYADRLLKASKHHLSIEAREGDALIFRVSLSTPA
jgi:hypothetical protein